MNEFNTFNSIIDLRLKLVHLDEINEPKYSVKLTNPVSHNVLTFEPAYAAEWVGNFVTNIITSNDEAVLLDVSGVQYILTIWQMNPVQVDLSKL